MYTKEDYELAEDLSVGVSVAAELRTLAGGDSEAATAASKASVGLNQCKARIIDDRFRKLEEERGK